MNMISEKICKLISTVKPELMKISPEAAGEKSSQGSWSKKEIIGHLIDSASNNHQRIVRAAQNSALDYPPYNQNQWVEVQKYNEMEWLDLVEFFSQYNLHLGRIINSLPDEVFNNLCNIGKDSPVTLSFIVEDYFRHLKHHLNKILEYQAL